MSKLSSQINEIISTMEREKVSATYVIPEPKICSFDANWKAKYNHSRIKRIVSAFKEKGYYCQHAITDILVVGKTLKALKNYKLKLLPSSLKHKLKRLDEVKRI